MSEPVSYVIGIHEGGDFTSYADSEGTDVGYDEHEAAWYETREEAVEALGNTPRKFDARIYQLVLSPDPSEIPTAQVVKKFGMVGEIGASEVPERK